MTQKRNTQAIKELFKPYIDLGYLNAIDSTLGGVEYRITYRGYHQINDVKNPDFIAAIRQAQNEYGDRAFQRTLAAVDRGEKAASLFPS